MGIFQSTMSRENSFDDDEIINNNELKSNIEENPVEVKEVEQIDEESKNEQDNKEGFFSKLLGKFMNKTDSSDSEEEKEQVEETVEEKEEE